MTVRDSLPPLVFLALVFAAAGLGARFTPGPWYADLAKPPPTPPNWIFAPVWTALYITIAIAAWVSFATYLNAGLRYLNR